MSNSGKQRSFVRDLIKLLKELGLEVTHEINKHNILRIGHQDRRVQVSISCTPSNRATAQRKVIAEVRRKIAELDESIAATFRPEGLMQMITQSSSSNPRNVINQKTPHYEELIHSLRISGLDKSTIDDVLKAVEAAINTEHIADNDLGVDDESDEDRNSSSVHNNNSKNDISVLSSFGNSPAKCSRVVTVMAKEQKNRVKAYTLKKSLQVLTDYYSHCLPITKLGVVVTDVWRPSDLFIFEVPLDYFEAQGIKTIIILKSNRNLFPINFPWR